MKDLRYPNLKKGYVFLISLRKGSRTVASGTAAKGLGKYDVNLEEIDEFVTTLLTGRVGPGWIRNLLPQEDAKAQYKRDNLHRCPQAVQDMSNFLCVRVPVSVVIGMDDAR